MESGKWRWKYEKGECFKVVYKPQKRSGMQSTKTAFAKAWKKIENGKWKVKSGKLKVEEW